MKLDLSALDSQTGATGEPLDIACDLIDPDPDQPRRRFDKKALEDLAGSIRERAAKGQRGVISPLSVRPNPAAPGRWLLNHGERRLRASLIAEQPTVPVFVDAGHDEDDQVIENIQREDLEPMELATYIAAQIDRGRKPSDIARRLGKNKAAITLYRTLAALPSALQRLYDRDICRSPRMLYDLERLHCKHPDEVDRWSKSRSEVITTRDVEALRDRLVAKKTPEAKASLDQSEAVGSDVADGSDVAEPSSTETSSSDDVRRLVVRHGDREAVVLLERAPVVLRYEDGTEAKASAADVILDRLEG